jgi:succinoglycan biosynthesis transport protein ExoP
MNKVDPLITRAQSSVQDDALNDMGAGLLDLDRIFGAIRRQFRIIAAGCILGLVFGLAYVLTAQPLYTATSQLLIDDQQVRALDQGPSSSRTGFDTAKVDSQVELLKSEKIALSVVDSMNLRENSDLFASQPSLIGAAVDSIKSILDFRRWFAEPVQLEAVSDERLTRWLVAKLRSNMDASRKGRTYVLEIAYTAPEPALAARFANAFADAYLLDQLDSKYEATRRASTWLQERIQELRSQSLEASLAVQRFRAENNLISARGSLVSEQQLSEINSELVVAQSNVAQTQARYDRIRTIIEDGRTDAAVNEALDNSIISNLRTRFLEASKRYNEIVQNLGPNHQQAISLQQEMTEYRRLIFDELGRIAQSYQSDLRIAEARVKALQASVLALVDVNATNNEDLVALRELEQEAESFQTLYQTFLQRYQEAVQEQSFPMTEARVITKAVPPYAASYPRKSLVLAFAIILGGMAGSAVGAYREYRDRGFRTGEQVRSQLNLECLGLLPSLKHKKLPVNITKSDSDEKSRRLKPNDVVLSQVLDAPRSAFTESLRSVKIAGDVVLSDDTSKVIGIISASPAEGKSTISKNYASLLASLGAKTLLLDCDIRNPGLTRSIAPHAETGLLDVLLEGKSFTENLLVEHESQLLFLPTVLHQKISHSNEIVSSARMKKLIHEASKSFDYIVVDLPPLGPVVDVRAMVPQIDAFLMVIEWGKTPRSMVRKVLEIDHRIRKKCLGVVLNKVDVEKQKMYEGYHTSEADYSAYASYYQNG